MKNQKVGALIVAAGESRRMEGTDKIFAPLSGKPLLARSVQVFEDCDEISQIVIVLQQNNLEKGEKLHREYGWRKVFEICPGGIRRQDSVGNGLDKLSGCDWVVIHDGARPFLSREMIVQGLRQAQKTGAAIAAVPVKDTIKQVSPEGTVQATPPRDCLRCIQTPQIFRTDLIRKAHREITEDVTDDAAMVEKLGHPVTVFDGSYDNIKVTTPQDLVLAKTILQNKGIE